MLVLGTLPYNAFYFRHMKTLKLPRPQSDWKYDFYSSLPSCSENKLIRWDSYKYLESL